MSLPGPSTNGTACCSVVRLQLAPPSLELCTSFYELRDSRVRHVRAYYTKSTGAVLFTASFSAARPKMCFGSNAQNSSAQ